MSFGSFNLFGFLQQPNTGNFLSTQTTQENLNYILDGGNGQSGTVADFNWYFPYALSKVPVEVLSSQEASYELALLSDSLLGGNLGIGLHFGTVTTQPSGNFWEDFNAIGLATTFSGDFQPVMMDSDGFSVLMSGDFQGFPTGFETSWIILSGHFPGDNINSSTLTMSFSGDFWPDFNLNILTLKNSGNFVQDNIQTLNFNYLILGDFYRIQSDDAYINYSFGTGYTAGTGAVPPLPSVSGVTGMDSAYISYAIRLFARGVN